MGIDMYVGNSIEEVLNNNSVIHMCIYDEFQDLILSYFEIFDNKKSQIFQDIAPYSDMILENTDILRLFNFSLHLLDEEILSLLETILHKYNITKRDFIEFSKSLSELCINAIKLNKNIITIGD